MKSSYALMMVLVFLFGCSAAKVAPAGMDPHTANLFSKCYDRNLKAGEVIYLCDEAPASTVQEDIRERPGYHVIGFFTDNAGRSLAHVADDCNHYFCQVCPHESTTQCALPKVRTVECCLARVTPAQK